MKNKQNVIRIVKYIVVTLIGIILLNLLCANLFSHQEYARRLEVGKVQLFHLLSTLYCFLMGALINWRAIENLVLRKTKLKPNRLLIPGALLLLVSAVHPAVVFQYIAQGLYMPFPTGGVGLNMLLGPLTYTSGIQHMIAVIAGVLMTRGLYQGDGAGAAVPEDSSE
jgi:hypothetical protein